MPRYFFHVRDSSGLIEDPDGIECFDGANVRTETIGLAREVMADHIRQGLDVSGWSFEVVDEHGQHVLPLQLSEAVRRV